MRMVYTCRCSSFALGAIYQILGQKPAFIRPPYGNYFSNKNMLQSNCVSGEYNADFRRIAASNGQASKSPISRCTVNVMLIHILVVTWDFE